MRKPSRFVAAGVLTAGLVLAASGVASADATANGMVSQSGGLLSGNLIQAPIDIQGNFCGNSISLLGLAHPAFANHCVNGDDEGTESHGVIFFHHDDDIATNDDDCG